VIRARAKAARLTNRDGTLEKKSYIIIPRYSNSNRRPHTNAHTRSELLLSPTATTKITGNTKRPSAPHADMQEPEPCSRNGLEPPGRICDSGVLDGDVEMWRSAGRGVLKFNIVLRGRGSGGVTNVTETGGGGVDEAGEERDLECIVCSRVEG
jgi:hypothetical protein